MCLIPVKRNLKVIAVKYVFLWQKSHAFPERRHILERWDNILQGCVFWPPIPSETLVGMQLSFAFSISLSSSPCLHVSGDLPHLLFPSIQDQIFLQVPDLRIALFCILSHPSLPLFIYPIIYLSQWQKEKMTKHEVKDAKCPRGV